MSTATYLVETTTPDEPTATTRELVTAKTGRPELPAVLEHLSDWLAGEAPETAQDRDDNADPDAWDRLFRQIEDDRNQACNLDPAGVRYAMPDGRVITATRLDADTLDGMTRGFVTALLWSRAEPIDMDPETGETGGLEGREPTRELREVARMYCARFLAANADDVQTHMDTFGDPDGGHPGEYVGHTFYLDGAGSGVSFTDRAWRDDDPMTTVCQRLRESADTFGDVEHLCAYELADGTVGL